MRAPRGSDEDQQRADDQDAGAEMRSGVDTSDEPDGSVHGARWPTWAASTEPGTADPETPPISEQVSLTAEATPCLSSGSEPTIGAGPRPAGAVVFLGAGRSSGSAMP
jgi:hypothetical protein